MDGSQQNVTWAADVTVESTVVSLQPFVSSLRADERVDELVGLDKDNGSVTIILRGGAINDTVRALYPILKAALRRAAPGSSVADAGLAISDVRRYLPDLPMTVQQDLLEALANGAEPTWILVKEAAVPGARRDRIEAELRALERQGLVRSRRELAADPSRAADSEDEWWQLTELGRDQIQE